MSEPKQVKSMHLTGPLSPLEVNDKKLFWSKSKVVSLSFGWRERERERELMTHL